MTESQGPGQQAAQSDTVEVACIGVFGREDAADRSLFSRPQEMRFGRGEITPHDLQRRLESFLGAMRQVIGGLSAQVGDWEMSTVTLSAEITAKGSVNILGTGGELSGRGGLTFTFIRHTDTNASQPVRPDAMESNVE